MKEGKFYEAEKKRKVIDKENSLAFLFLFCFPPFLLKTKEMSNKEKILTLLPSLPPPLLNLFSKIAKKREREKNNSLIFFLYSSTSSS